jgi:putative Ca2+/H+ antiporter (TMEM165/GDT1 family)
VYWAVMIAELIGDKTIYTVTSLALRFRAAKVLTVIALVYSLKMAAAVQLGSYIVRLRSPTVAFVSAGAFFVSAAFLALQKPAPAELSNGPLWRGGTMTCFTSLLLTEWGDPGQIVAAASAARFHPAVIVWLAGTLAMVTKATLALLVGVKLRDRLPQRVLRIAGALSLSVLGVLTLTQIAAE